MDTPGEGRIGVLQRCPKDPMDPDLCHSPDLDLGNTSSPRSQRYRRCALSTMLPNCRHSAMGRRWEESCTEEAHPQTEAGRQGGRSHAEVQTLARNPRSLNVANTAYCNSYGHQSRLYNALPGYSTGSCQPLRSQSSCSVILLLLPERAQQFLPTSNIATATTTASTAAATSGTLVLQTYPSSSSCFTHEGQRGPRLERSQPAAETTRLH